MSARKHPCAPRAPLANFPGPLVIHYSSCDNISVWLWACGSCPSPLLCEYNTREDSWDVPMVAASQIVPLFLSHQTTRKHTSCSYMHPTIDLAVVSEPDQREPPLSHPCRGHCGSSLVSSRTGRRLNIGSPFQDHSDSYLRIARAYIQQSQYDR